MAAFLVVAALMAVVAAAAVAWPLLRDRGSRAVGALAAVLVIGSAAGLYPLWSNWDWNAPADSAGANAAAAAAASPEVAAMVAKLEQKLKSNPDDLKGWLMLGRSYLALERPADAIVAYDRAVRLSDSKDVEALLGLGEALSLKAGGDITPQAAQLFEEAANLAPDNPKALLYGGFAAAVRGENALARSRWEALKALNPPPEVVRMLDERIAELGAGPGDAGPGAAMAAAPAGAPPAAADPNATATVNIQIAPALKSKLHDGVPLFVFAREPGGQGPPLAAKRLTVAAIGTQIQLSAADSMMPSRVIHAGQRVSITARVSFSGQPLPSSGDLYGELSYEVGKDGARDLVIDQVTP